MKFLADFHIHSKYSYATSKTMDLKELAIWGQLKGLGLMGTGDFTHPVWRKELQELLIPGEQGLFHVRPQLQAQVDAQVYSSCRGQQRFLLTAEISTIFRRSVKKVFTGQQGLFTDHTATEINKCYKSHSIIFAPTLEVAEKISQKLAAKGNITYDGRPTLGLDVKDLLKLVLDVSSDCMLIPAHIWTPHFGLLGSKSGFDSFHEAFGDLVDHIYAFEKGLSSNYVMNAQVSELDRFAILCNSDAHSVQNLGREANLLDTDMSYAAITKALKTNDKQSLVAGIEFFPEMGKYFGSGHRACGVYATPEQMQTNSKCIICHKALTEGVSYRVSQLADRTVLQATKVMRQRFRIAPLQEIIAINLGVQETSKKVQQLYHHLLSSIGNEFYILLDAVIDDIARESTVEIAQSIDAVRQGKVQLTPGYDGIYGKIDFKV